MSELEWTRYKRGEVSPDVRAHWCFCANDESEYGSEYAYRWSVCFIKGEGYTIYDHPYPDVDLSILKKCRMVAGPYPSLKAAKVAYRLAIARGEVGVV